MMIPLMARRTKSRKRKYLGNRTYGGGNAKNRRGKGSRGGVGRAGYHKHKWLRTIKEGLHSSRRRGFENPTRKDACEISLREIQAGIDAGKYQKNNEGKFAVNAGSGCKILSQGHIKEPVALVAGGISAKAKEKIENSGGSATVE